MGRKTYQKGERTELFRHIEEAIQTWYAVNPTVRMPKYKQHELASYIFDAQLESYDDILNDISVYVMKNH